MYSIKRKKSISSEQEPLKNENFSHRLIHVLLTHIHYTFDIELSEKNKELVLSKYWTLIGHYIVDFFICNFIISLAVVSFWRGVWDYSIVYFKALLKQENNWVATFLKIKVFILYLIFNRRSTIYLL